MTRKELRQQIQEVCNGFTDILPTKQPYQKNWLVRFFKQNMPESVLREWNHVPGTKNKTEQGKHEVEFFLTNSPRWYSPEKSGFWILRAKPNTLIDTFESLKEIVSDNLSDQGEEDKKQNRMRRSNTLLLDDCHLEIGDKLIFDKTDPNGEDYQAIVLDNKKIWFEGTEYSCTAAAAEIFKRISPGSSRCEKVNGMDYWRHEGKRLSELRDLNNN